MTTMKTINHGATMNANDAVTLKAFFAFKRHPFPPACAPQPLFRSNSLDAALLQAKNALSSRLHLLVTAPPGLGKSSFCRLLLDELNPREFKPLYLVGQPVGLTDLLRSVADAFGLESSCRRGRAAAFLAQGLEKIAASSAAHPVLILDEAQQLPMEAIEMLRLIAETQNRSLLSLVLVATDDFPRLLARPAFAPLAGRFSLRLRMNPLSPDQAAGFVEHAFAAVGMDNILAPNAIASLHAASSGSPRRIGAFLAAAMQRALIKRSRLLTDEIIQEVIDEPTL
jgi:type II secretory pathway predicted ATPase ExeA